MRDSKHDQEEFMEDFSELAVPDVIDYNLNSKILGMVCVSHADPKLKCYFFLLVLFVGLFSGKKSIKEGHHFSSSNNHFYHALYESGI